MGKLRERRPLAGWRRVGRIALWIIVFMVVLFSLQVAMAYNPVVFFPHEITHKNITVHMREEIPDEITGILDVASERIACSEINDPNLHHEVFICNSFTLSRFLLWHNVYFGCNLPNGVTYIVMADVKNDRAYSELDGEKDPQFVRMLTETIAHEVAHRLMRNRAGYMADRKLPVWIREGYCEYISRGCPVDQGYALEQVRAGRGAGMRGVSYFWDRLMVGYLIEERGIGFDGLVGDGYSRCVVQSEMLAVLRGEGGDGFLEKIGIEDTGDGID